MASSTTEKILVQTLEDLQRRSEVEDVLKEMLMDVELAVTLNREIAYKAQQSELEERAAVCETALSEARIVEEQDRASRSQLADELLKEIWKLSEELGGLKRWKKQHQHTVSEHDELVAKLMQTEEELQLLRSRITADTQNDTKQSPQDQKLGEERVTKGQPDVKPEEASGEHRQETRREGIVTPEIGEKKSEVASLGNQVVSATTDATEAKEPIEENEGNIDEVLTAKFEEAGGGGPADNDQKLATRGDTTLSQEPAQASATGQQTPPTDQEPSVDVAVSPSQDDTVPSVVALLSEDEETPSLETLDPEALLRIFNFLDAVEILNLAQVNVGFYSRVDSLFGTGSDPMPEVEKVPAPAAAVSVAPPVVTTPKSAPKPKAEKPTLGLFGMLQTKPKQAAKVEPAAHVAQPTLLPAAGSKSPPAPTGERSVGLSATMANSLAAKLNDSEINAIISMTEKLRQREDEVMMLKSRNFELAGKLDGTEAVKEFLVSKVREIENAMTKNRDSEGKLTQQIASDQEVIAFLDGRVQELERNQRVLLSEKESLTNDLKQKRDQNDKKVAVLSDMLQFEREKLAEDEREWKSAKKVLVKEVKSCRTQILALQAERDGLREQNGQLQKAMLTSGVAANGPASPDRRALYSD